MDLSARPLAPNPYDLLPHFPSFTLTSTDMVDDGALPTSATAQGGSRSPQLSWSGFPDGTRSFLVTCFDPDAPTPAGFWHWCAANVPGSVAELAAGAGASDAELSGGFHCPNDTGQRNFFGAAPPAGDRAHRYIFAVHALDVDSLDVDHDTRPTAVSFQALFHTLAIATVTGMYRTPEDAG
ncbi:YbhB/YbcL family Raf kinase inhibitor-like protein [Nanchangia anserum]|uniref:YbhB/YbcL family Raf kinase inhibitor-like protein n=1 Tax=Nanchangia anserum TaxID=2692125 RepID=A0A8I0GBS6_9ACTO|nr:YbhB/YbcL family Raf kinase inhibitor-like protein [Nanchangia anserum]MBD3688668.1 YbhB/YbcL family Raf kinase inhibitor-like protein [Nanchangia anserum]